MTRTIRQSDYFWADLLKQVEWYRLQAGPEVAGRYIDAVEATLRRLAAVPGLGRPRFKNWPELAGIRSFRVEQPFHRHLIFYRFDEESLLAERVVHGARDLPCRLLRSPHDDE
ncbi:MAG: type II toxin-antitoxin system RelE/ParE family toxin [Verrucomicrobiota bacterium]